MLFRISPLWWPALALTSPVLLPGLFLRNRKFKEDIAKAEWLNRKRISEATLLDLPELAAIELQVLVEYKAAPGYKSVPGISYLLRTERGSLLFDVGFGPENPCLAYNSERLGVNLDKVDALAISHLHPDHMGGFKASRRNEICLPPAMYNGKTRNCYVCGSSVQGQDLNIIEVTSPITLPAGFGSTGPLARPLFLMGWTEEQALIARIKNKGLVVLTGCGHPTIEVILVMAQQLCREPVYVIGGGLHFPVTDSPLKKPGLKVQMIWGTGKPPWQRITGEDLEQTIDFLNTTNANKVLISGHDSCDYSIQTLQTKLNCQTSVLQAGSTYRL